MIMAFFSTTSFKPPFSSWTVLFLVILLVNPSSSTSRGEMDSQLRSLSEGSEPHHHLETISSSQPSKKPGIFGFLQPKKGGPEPPSSKVHATPSRWETIWSSQRSMHVGSSGGMLRKNSEPVSPDPISRQHNLEIDANATPSRVSSSQRSMRVGSEPPRQHNLETKLSSQRSMSEPTSGGMLRKTNSEPVAPDPNSRRHNLETKLSSQRSMGVGSEPIAGMLPKNSEPTSRQHNSEIKSSSQRSMHASGGLFFGMLPKGNPVPPSGPSRSHN